AEEERAVRRPDRAFRELEAARHALERAGDGDVALDLERRLVGGRSVQLERRAAHPDVVGRRGGDRTVDAEDGEPEGLPGPRIAREHDAVGYVEAARDA